MEENHNDITAPNKPDADAQALLRYLQQTLPAEEQHELEKQMLDDAFTADALEGLSDFKNTPAITAVVDQLNRDLKRKTAKKKTKAGRLLQVDAATLIAIVLILLFVVLGYFVIHRLKQRGTGTISVLPALAANGN